MPFTLPEALDERNYLLKQGKKGEVLNQGNGFIVFPSASTALRDNRTVPAGAAERHAMHKRLSNFKLARYLLV